MADSNINSNIFEIALKLNKLKTSLLKTYSQGLQDYSKLTPELLQSTPKLLHCDSRITPELLQSYSNLL